MSEAPSRSSQRHSANSANSADSGANGHSSKLSPELAQRKLDDFHAAHDELAQMARAQKKQEVDSFVSTRLSSKLFNITSRTSYRTISKSIESMKIISFQYITLQDERRQWEAEFKAELERQQRAQQAQANLAHAQAAAQQRQSASEAALLGQLAQQELQRREQQAAQALQMQQAAAVYN